MSGVSGDARPNPKGDQMSESANITPKEIADEMGVSDKRVRSILRSMTSDRAGRGNSWALTPEIADAIRAEITQRRTSNGGGKRVTPVLRPEFVKAEADDEG